MSKPLLRIGASGAPDPFEIDILLPVTGSGAFYAPSQQQSLHVVEDSANKTRGIDGCPLKFVINDDQSHARIAVQLAGQITAKHPAVILGPTFTAQCNARMTLVKDGPTIWCFTPGSRPIAGGYVFAFGAVTSHTSAVSIRYLKAKGITRIGLISSTDATGQDGERNATAAAAGRLNATRLC